jgi:hypothetical protein
MITFYVNICGFRPWVGSKLRKIEPKNGCGLQYLQLNYGTSFCGRCLISFAVKRYIAHVPRVVRASPQYMTHRQVTTVFIDAFKKFTNKVATWCWSSG